jgi:hypothetical protein
MSPLMFALGCSSHSVTQKQGHFVGQNWELCLDVVSTARGSGWVDDKYAYLLTI